eukprot:TRINITY_DN25698_c0_g1_i1.p1 TRINITY_DN25698_c0_g1~~TRINITY_DN25698_c0_g1_i1.p1  ORF type:complete len:956 (+),score=141.81 TRINITY_DN25698_c0_g1_i1:62-2869(+)
MDASRSVVSSVPSSPHGSNEKMASGSGLRRAAPAHGVVVTSRTQADACGRGIVVNGASASLIDYAPSLDPSVTLVSNPGASGVTGVTTTESTVIPAVHKLHVTIIQATDLKNMNMAGESPFCVCEVKHADKRAKRTKCETRVVRKTLDPVWNEEHELEPWQVGEPLEFTVFDQSSVGAKIEGKVLLQSDYFYPNGIEADLGLSSSPGFGVLRVRIVPAAVQAANTAPSSSGGGGTGEIPVIPSYSPKESSLAADPAAATGSPLPLASTVGLATGREPGRHSNLQLSRGLSPGAHRGASSKVLSPRAGSNLVGVAGNRFAASVPPRLRAAGGMTSLTTTTNSAQVTAPGTPSGSFQSTARQETANTGETIDVLRTEIGDLRSELELLRGMLSEGLQQRDEAEKSRSIATQDVEKLRRRKFEAEAQLRDANVEAQRLRSELAAHKRPSSLQRSTQQLHRSGAESARRRSDADSETASLKMPRSRGSSTTDLRAGVLSPPRRHDEAHTNFGIGSQSVRQQGTSPSGLFHSRSFGNMEKSAGSLGSVPRGRSASLHADAEGQSPKSRAAPLPPQSASRADDIDTLWCDALKNFPHNPEWILVKEKHGVYRMGCPTGKKILCRISHGGLQVRVGGGWMSAVPFLERYGPQGMVSKQGDETPTIGGGVSTPLIHDQGSSMMNTPPSMERLLVPTKCWASKVGINTMADQREYRRSTPEEVVASKRSPSPIPGERMLALDEMRQLQQQQLFQQQVQLHQQQQQHVRTASSFSPERSLLSVDALQSRGRLPNETSSVGRPATSYQARQSSPPCVASHVGPPTTILTPVGGAATPIGRTAAMTSLIGGGRVTVAPGGGASVVGGHGVSAGGATVTSAPPTSPPSLTPSAAGSSHLAPGQMGTSSNGQGHVVQLPWHGQLAQRVSQIPMAQPPPRVLHGHMSIAR